MSVMNENFYEGLLKFSQQLEQIDARICFLKYHADTFGSMSIEIQKKGVKTMHHYDGKDGTWNDDPDRSLGRFDKLFKLVDG